MRVWMRGYIPALAAGLVLVLGVILPGAAQGAAPPMPPTLPGVPAPPGATGGWPAQYEGQPAVIARAQPAYYLWVDQLGWHVRFTTSGLALFSGSVTTDGRFQNVSGATVQGNVLAFGRPGILGPGILGAARGTAGGFDFNTTGNVLTFHFNVNQTQAAPRQVYLGRNGVHPARVPFTASRTAMGVTKPPKDPTWERPRPCGGDAPCN